MPTNAERSVATRLRLAGCVYAEEEARLLIAAARSSADLDGMVRRRAAGEPVEHVIGWAEFCGQRIVVDQGVFVPRRRTEFLVRQAAALARRPASHGGGQLVIVDLCCGSGAVGAALAAALSPAKLYAADIDPAAVACARRNLGAVGGCVYLGDLYEALPPALAGAVTLLTANTPYVPAAEIALLPAEAREHESRTALDGGPDGLRVARPVIAGAPRWLAPGGHVVIETSERQAAALASTVSHAGLEPAVVSSDEFDATVVIGTRRVDGPGS